MSMPGDAATTDHLAAGPLAAPLGARLAGIWRLIERALVRLGDYLNPILVKETRQALKSSQFTFTFVLVLVACWVVTIGGVAIIGPGIVYSAAGGTLLFAYYFILAFPLILMIPAAGVYVPGFPGPGDDRAAAGDTQPAANGADIFAGGVCRRVAGPVRHLAAIRPRIDSIWLFDDGR
jgi:hypothetical protein